jgi:hypothetical protein
MKEIDLITAIATAPRRDDVLGGADPATARAAVALLVERLGATGWYDPIEILGILVQRFEVAALDLELVDAMASMPSITEQTITSKVSDRLRSMLGGTVPDLLVRHHESRVRHAARIINGRVGARDDHAVVVANMVPGQPLRCSQCGFAFRLQDFPSRLAEIVSELGATTADTVSTGRARDLFKPLRGTGRDGRPIAHTEVQVDHVVPTAGLGDNDARNLVLSCRWCNAGKSAFRSFSEALPELHAVVYSDLRSAWAVRNVQRAFFCALSRRRSCAECKRGPRDRELTVRPSEVPPKTEFRMRHLLFARVVCYECDPGEAD